METLNQIVVIARDSGASLAYSGDEPEKWIEKKAALAMEEGYVLKHHRQKHGDEWYDFLDGPHLVFSLILTTKEVPMK